MSRSGYTCDGGGDEWDMIRWRGAVKSAIRGRRGQRFLRELIEALDAMPKKELIPNVFESDEGCCAMGAWGRSKGVDMSDLNPTEDELWENAFCDSRWNREAADRADVARALVSELEFVNDEYGLDIEGKQSPSDRWKFVRDWAEKNLVREVSDV